MRTNPIDRLLTRSSTTILLSGSFPHFRYCKIGCNHDGFITDIGNTFFSSVLGFKIVSWIIHQLFPGFFVLAKFDKIPILVFLDCGICSGENY